MKKTLKCVLMFLPLVVTGCSGADDKPVSSTPAPAKTATPAVVVTSSAELTWDTGAQALFLNHCSCHSSMTTQLSYVQTKRLEILSRIGSTEASRMMPKPNSVKVSWKDDKAKMETYLSSSVLK